MKITTIFLIILISLTLIGNVNAYMVNKAKTAIKKPPINETIELKIFNNYLLLKLVGNLSCMEYPSPGIQAGCSVFKEKVMVLLGKKPEKYSVMPSFSTVYQERKICYKDLGGFTEYGPGYHIVMLDRGKEIPLNRTIYPEGVRIYGKKNFNINDSEVN